jgi:hypothetical protein
LCSPQSSLDNLKAPPETGFPADDTALKVDLDIVVSDLAMALRGVIVPEHHHGSDHIDALVGGLNENERVPLVRGWIGRVSQGEDDVHSVSRVSGS